MHKKLTYLKDISINETSLKELLIKYLMTKLINQ